MYLIPIELDESLNTRFLDEPECAEVLDVFINHYKKVGFFKPWIAYFVADENNVFIGGGGFKGRPHEGKIEVSYGTFKKFEGKGVGTEICRKLVSMALNTDPSLKITARTLPDNYSSIGVLRKNGFVLVGKIHDEDDGEVLEWQFKEMTIPKKHAFNTEK